MRKCQCTNNVDASFTTGGPLRFETQGSFFSRCHACAPMCTLRFTAFSAMFAPASASQPGYQSRCRLLAEERHDDSSNGDSHEHDSETVSIEEGVEKHLRHSVLVRSYRTPGAGTRVSHADTARPMSGRLVRRRDRGLDCFTPARLSPRSMTAP